jgi:hypothetical protein
MEWSFDSTTPQWRELSDRINHNEPADTVAFMSYTQKNNSTAEPVKTTLVVLDIILSSKLTMKKP